MRLRNCLLYTGYMREEKEEGRNEGSLLALALGRGQALGELVARALGVAKEHLGARVVEQRVRDLGIA